jgi:hypothetical protein
VSTRPITDRPPLRTQAKTTCGICSDIVTLPWW